MAVTFKAFLDERRKKMDGTYPLKIRVTIDGKHKEIGLNVDLQKKDWNGKYQLVKDTHPNSKLIQLKISKALNTIQEKALLFENLDRTFSIDDITDGLSNNQSRITFIDFFKEAIQQQLKMGKVGNSVAYSCSLSKLQKHIGNKPLKFENINGKFLDSYTIAMIEEGIRINTISNYIRTLRTIFNKAIKAGVVERKYYPFTEYKIKNEKTISRSLTLGELRSLIAVEIDTSTNMWHYQNLFVLSFCFIGINFSDLLTLKLENVEDGRLVFRRKKTGKIYSIKIQQEAQRRLQFYLKDVQKNPNDFIFPFVKSSDSPLRFYKKIGLLIHATNENLRKIAGMAGMHRNVTTYYARYTWANIAKALGYSKDLIAEALGHEYGNRVTGIYLDNYDNVVIDEMNEKVLDYVFPN